MNDIVVAKIEGKQIKIYRKNEESFISNPNFYTIVKNKNELKLLIETLIVLDNTFI
jgi:hypothetical protein